MMRGKVAMGRWVRTAIATGLLPALAFATTRTYPGAVPCNTTLQACITGATGGDVIEVATNGTIDEDLSVNKSLTLQPATGYTPTIGNVAGTTRTVSLQNGGPAAVAITLQDLVLSNAAVDISLSNGSGHNIVVRGCSVSHAVNSNNATGIGASVSAPAQVEISRNTVSVTGVAVRLSTNMSGGSASFIVVGNRLTASQTNLGYQGVQMRPNGAGNVTALVASNVIYGLTGCNCGNAVGIEVGAGGSTAVTANVVGNTLDYLPSGRGIYVGTPTVTASLLANIYDNIVTQAADAGLSLPSVSAQLTVNNGHNDFHANGSPPDFGGYAAGPSTLDVDPGYVNASLADYHLGGASPLIDAGTGSVTLADIDADGNPRVQGAAVDIGAYETGPTTSTTTTVVGATSTTTIPVCEQAATFASIGCRLTVLAANANAFTPAGALRDALAAAVAKAEDALQAAEAATKTGARKRALGRAGKALGKFAAKVRKAKKTLASDPRQMLLDAAAALRQDVRTLRKS